MHRKEFHIVLSASLQYRNIHLHQFSNSSRRFGVLSRAWNFTRASGKDISSHTSVDLLTVIGESLKAVIMFPGRATRVTGSEVGGGIWVYHFLPRVIGVWDDAENKKLLFVCDCGFDFSYSLPNESGDAESLGTSPFFLSVQSIECGRRVSQNNISLLPPIQKLVTRLPLVQRQHTAADVK